MESSNNRDVFVMAMQIIPSEYTLIPTTIEQATNTSKQVLHNTSVIQPDCAFFESDFDYIYYDEQGKRMTQSASTNFLEKGNYCVIVLPSAHSLSTLQNTNDSLQALINDLAKLKMEFGKVVFITNDTVDELHDWVVNAVKQAPWYNAQRHNKLNILQDLEITPISDISCRLINALGMARQSNDGSFGITGGKGILCVQNGMVKHVWHDSELHAIPASTIQSSAAETTPNKNGKFQKLRSISNNYTLIPQSIDEALDHNQRKIHNKNVIEPGDMLYQLKYDDLSYDTYGNINRKISSTNFLAQGNHCIITLPGSYNTSTLNNVDPHLQDYLENIHRLNAKFDRLVIVGKGHAGQLHQTVKNAIKQASWFDATLHDKLDILQQLNIAIIPDNGAQLINALGLAVDGHKRGILSKRALIVSVDGTAVAVQYENDPLVGDRVNPSVAIEALTSLNLPAKNPSILFGTHPTQKISIVGGGIIGAMEAYFAYLEARKNRRQIRVTVYDKNALLTDTTASNIAPSLTPDEILSVVPRGKALADALSVNFDKPGGINVNDEINKTDVARNFIAQVELYRQYEEEHKNRTNALLQLGKISMDLWQKIYDDADAELKQIFKDANFNPCREPLRKDGSLHDGYRVDIIYNVADARTKAENMKSDYTGIGYKHCKILSPDETVEKDPSLAEFCAQNSETDANGNLVWKKDAVALYRPGGCLDTNVFLPKFYDYLQKVMGQYTNEYGIVKDCFRLKFLKEVNGVVFGPGTVEDDNDKIIGLKIKDPSTQHDNIKYPKHNYAKSDYIFATGEKVGSLTQFGFKEPAYAAFAGPSLKLRIPVPEELQAQYASFNHCMEVHQVGVVLAWQARSTGKEILISVAGTKAFYGDTIPNVDEVFARNRNLLQLNMINDVLPQFVSIAYGRDTKGQKLAYEDLQELEDKGIAKRWVGNRAVIYDGVPIFGALYKHDGTKVRNAGATEYLSSGGVSFAPAAVLFSRRSLQKEDIFPIFPSETLEDIAQYTASNRKVPGC